ncbi:CYR61-like [Pelobates cultripes]|uniref:CYR61-like n=1 Tax=Pelobates cultripes TaxID=61616 RepID=A0AAD1T1T4_PELCU|nr:CYR61-like [Pelobates cultripes]CAH2314340.1 CYR61-like [Pelobates cultripes]CAH2314342.1 CYR61-like [Pelobates cultripes]
MVRVVRPILYPWTYLFMLIEQSVYIEVDVQDQLEDIGGGLTEDMSSFRAMCFIFLFVPYAVGKDKVTPHPIEEKQGCPKVCKCPVKLTCPLGRPKAFDKCECGCRVCVQTLDSACDGFRPCDATQNLTCVYSTGPENKQGVCKVIRKHRSCFNNGTEVLHGQTFQDGCTGHCKCDDGMISCVSLCPPVRSAPIPGCLDMRYESVPGECCKQWKCVKYESTDPNLSQGDLLHPTSKEDSNLTANSQGVKDGVIGKQRSCLIDGTEYLHGEKFQFGCVGRCECRDGAIGCSSLCPPSQPAPIPGCKKMQLESVPGQCCKEWKCKKYDSDGQSQGLPLSPTSNKNDSHGVKGPGVKRRTREISDIEDDDSLNSEFTCTKEATEWTTCSRPCGFGRSVRLNYDQETCRPQAERRLCMIRPCMGEYTAANYTILKSSKVCNRLVRWSEPLHLYHRGCQSVRSVQPRFCGQCTDGRICAPSASETLSLVFHCPHNNRRVTRQIMWLVNCSCGKKGGKKRGERKKGEENNIEKEMGGNKGTEIEELATNDIEVGG